MAFSADPSALETTSSGGRIIGTYPLKLQYNLPRGCCSESFLQCSSCCLNSASACCTVDITRACALSSIFQLFDISFDYLERMLWLVDDYCGCWGACRSAQLNRISFGLFSETVVASKELQEERSAVEVSSNLCSFTWTREKSSDAMWHALELLARTMSNVA